MYILGSCIRNSGKTSQNIRVEWVKMQLLQSVKIECSFRFSCSTLRGGGRREGVVRNSETCPTTTAAFYKQTDNQCKRLLSSHLSLRWDGGGGWLWRDEMLYLYSRHTLGSGMGSGEG